MIPYLKKQNVIPWNGHGFCETGWLGAESGRSRTLSPRELPAYPDCHARGIPESVKITET